MAGKTISNMTSAGTLDGDELFEIVQGGSTRKVALSTLLKYVQANIENFFTLTGVWQFDAKTSSSDPGGGKFNVNNSNQALATFIYINDEAENSIDFGLILSKLSDGDAILIQDKEDSDRSVLYEVNGNATDNGGYWSVPVDNGDQGSKSLEDGGKCGFIFFFSA